MAIGTVAKNFLPRQDHETDNDYFTRLFHSFYPMLVRYSTKRWRMVRELAEEIVGDVFCKVVESKNSMQKLMEMNAFQADAYLLKVTCSAVADYFNKRKKESELLVSNDDEEITQELITDRSTEEYYFMKINNEDAVWAIKQLPEKYRKVLLLKTVNKATDEEVEAATGVPSRNVREYVHRARQKLKMLLNERRNNDETC